MYDKILVPFDGSVASLLGLDEAIKLAKNQSAKLRVVHVIDELIVSDAITAYSDDVLDTMRENGQKILKTAQTRVEWAGYAADTVMREQLGGPAAPRIIEEAKQWSASLIVLGTHGRRGLKRLVMGSDAEEIIRTTPVPVLLIRAPRAERESIEPLA